MLSRYRLSSRVLRLDINIDFVCAEYIIESHSGISGLQRVKFSLERHTLEERNFLGDCGVGILLEQSCVAIVVRASEKDMLAVKVT